MEDPACHGCAHGRTIQGPCCPPGVDKTRPIRSKSRYHRARGSPIPLGRQVQSGIQEGYAGECHARHQHVISWLIHQWLPVWAPCPPVTALVYFHPRYGNHPLILQYAMRVLEQHPVDLTFFFVPQCVQALRSDGLGYVERFIFETSKISQLFCHQIIWNMKANTYKDDDAVSCHVPGGRRM